MLLRCTLAVVLVVVLTYLLVLRRSRVRRSSRWEKRRQPGPDAAGSVAVGPGWDEETVVAQGVQTQLTSFTWL